MYQLRAKEACKQEQLQRRNQNKIQNPRWFVQLNIKADQQIMLNNEYVLYELIQKNEYFDVYLAMQLKNKVKVMVQIFDKNAYKQMLKQMRIKDFQQRFNQMIQKIKIQDYFQIKFNRRIAGLFMIETYKVFYNHQYHIKICENYYGQTLQQMIRRRTSVPLNEALAIIKQIIIQLSQYHRQGIILTILDPRYIQHRNGIYKITDLSSMKKTSQKFTKNWLCKQNDNFANAVAPQLVICPEVVDIKSQIWAIGILFYYLIAHKVPYNQRLNDILNQIKNQNITFQMRSGHVSEQVLIFLKQLLVVNPQQRISWKKLMNHQIFENQDHFYRMKLNPIVDARHITLKKKQDDIIIEQSFNIKQQYDCYSQVLQQKSQQVQNQNLFTQIDRVNKIKLNNYIDIQEQTFYHIKVFNLKALKITYIIEQIIEKIQKYNLIDQHRRSHIQTMFLISQRCFLYTRHIQETKRKIPQRRIQNYAQQTKKLTTKVKTLFDYYNKRLHKLQKSAFYIGNDIFSSVLKKSKIKQRQNFLKGHQQIDYTASQHIKFTQEKYINKILSQLKGQATVLEYVKLNLKYYQKIYQINQQQIQKDKTFQQVVSELINREEQKVKSQIKTKVKQQKQHKSKK